MQRLPRQRRQSRAQHLEAVNIVQWLPLRWLLQPVHFVRVQVQMQVRTPARLPRQHRHPDMSTSTARALSRKMAQATLMPMSPRLERRQLRHLPQCPPKRSLRRKAKQLRQSRLAALSSSRQCRLAAQRSSHAIRRLLRCRQSSCSATSRRLLPMLAALQGLLRLQVLLLCVEKQQQLVQEALVLMTHSMMISMVATRITARHSMTRRRQRLQRLRLRQLAKHRPQTRAEPALEQSQRRRLAAEALPGPHHPTATARRALPVLLLALQGPSTAPAWAMRVAMATETRTIMAATCQGSWVRRSPFCL